MSVERLAATCHVVVIDTLGITTPPPDLADLLASSWQSTIVDAVVASAVSADEAATFLTLRPAAARSTDRYARELLAIARSQVRALDAVIAADHYPALVVHADLVRAPRPELPTLAEPWDIALLGGYRRGRTAQDPTDRWVAATRGWYGVIAYAVANRTAAARLRAVWADEREEPDLAWGPVLADLHAVGIEPPAILDAPLATPDPRPFSATPGKLDGAPIWWINLDRRPDRRLSILAQTADWPGSVTRVRAADAFDIPAWQVADFAPIQPQKHYRLREGERLLRGEIAGTRSHRLAMEAILAAGIYPAIVLEDDAVLQPTWGRWQDLPQDAEFVSFGSTLGAATMKARGGRPVELGWRRPEPTEIWSLSHAYAIMNEPTAAALQRMARAEARGFDRAWTPILTERVAYMLNPHLAVQTRIDSDLRTLPAS